MKHSSPSEGKVGSPFLVATFFIMKEGDLSRMLDKFSNPEFGIVRTILIDECVWFVGKDIASILEYENTNDAISKHVSELDKKTVKLSDIQDPRENLPSHMKGSKVIIINESGLYSLIFRSNKPKAIEFNRWVTSEVLPSIRKKGFYSLLKESQINSISKDECEMRMREARNESARILERVAGRTDIPEYKKVIDHYIVGIVTNNENALPLPIVNEKTYSATDIGKMLGVSSQKIGKLSNEHNMKTDEFGKWFYDKSRHSNKEVETFRYYEKAIGEFKRLLNIS